MRVRRRPQVETAWRQTARNAFGGRARVRANVQPYANESIRTSAGLLLRSLLRYEQFLDAGVFNAGADHWIRDAFA